MEIITDSVPNPRGTAFVHHGYPGGAHSPTIQLMRKTFNGLGLNTVTPNTANNYNESDGDLKDMTLAGHSDDLEDVIRFEIAQESLTGPIIIAGHSAGGHSALSVSSRFKGLAQPVLTIASAPFISGQSFIDAWSTLIGKMATYRWQKNGFTTGYSDAGPDELKLYWDVYQEWAKHDLARDQISPDNHTAIIHPENDPVIPKADMIQYIQATGTQEFHSIRGADHGYTGQERAFASKLDSIVRQRLG
jgi:pimeloyl-ACP methyl ester carboxylesterase